ncbi:MAG: DOMON-like domain-containing protein [Allosphingosinicella sp.]
MLLIADPALPPQRIREMRAILERLSANNLRLVFEMKGDIANLILPPSAPPERSDRLWETTCFELFLKPAHGCGYRELNFSPSGRWAAYDFSAYRAGMVQAGVPAPPSLVLDRSDEALKAEILFSIDLHQEPYRYGLCAVLEERGGYKSYWTQKCGPGPPDFHHPACFDEDLPPAPL